MSLFGARYLDIFLPSLISSHKTLVRDLTIAYMWSSSTSPSLGMGSGSTTSNMPGARVSAEKFSGWEQQKKY